MAGPSEFPDLGPWVQVNRKKLMGIVAKSPFTQQEFERIVGADFVQTAPQAKKNIAWELLQRKKSDQELLREAFRHFPKAYITGFSDVPAAHGDGVDAAGPDGRP
jgi:hypothetical protein